MTNKLGNNLKKFGIFLREINPYIQTLLSLIAIFLAIKAINIARTTVDTANEQYISNSIKSDSLFNFQIKITKEQNDSIISQFNLLQEINQNQFEINTKLLESANKNYYRSLYSDRPQILLKKLYILDSNRIIDEKYAPIILMEYGNTGNRYAFNLEILPILIYKDLSNYTTGYDQEEINNCEPKAVYHSHFLPKINIEEKNEYYICVGIKYFDKELNKEFSDSYYFIYTKYRGEFDFYNCKEDEKIKLRKFINQLTIKFDLEFIFK